MTVSVYVVTPAGVSAALTADVTAGMSVGESAAVLMLCICIIMLFVLSWLESSSEHRKQGVGTWFAVDQLFVQLFRTNVKY